MSPVELLGLLAGGIGVFYGLPQARQVRAAGHGDGVSVTSWLLMFVTSVMWASFGVRVGAFSVILTNVLATLVNASVVVALLGRSTKVLRNLAASVVVLALSVLLAPQALVSAMLVALVFGQTPQLLASIRNLRERRDSVVSLHAMAVAITSLFCWEAYAVLSNTPIMILTSTLALAMTGSVATLEILAKRARALAA